MMNNPVRYTDPSGHSPADYLNDAARSGYWQSKGTGAPTAEITVNLSTSIPENTLEAQYHSPDWNNSRRYVNLCGHIAVEVAYEAITGKTDTLDDLIQENDYWNPEIGKDTTTGVGHLMLMVMEENFFPNGTVAVGYNGAEKSIGGSGIGYLQGIPLGKNFYEDGALKGLVMGMLSMGHYVIAGGMLNTGDGRMDTGGNTAHWVMITGISGDYVRIYNPFTNSVQYMMWSDYEASFMAGKCKQLLEIFEIQRPEPAPIDPPGST